MDRDCFAELGLERRLVVGPDDLQSGYDRRCAEAHPDRGGEAEVFQNLREAYGVLRSPGRRLRHWLELEGRGWSEGGSLEGEVEVLFGTLGPLLRRAQEVAGRIAASQSVLARSLAEREGIVLLGELEAVRDRVRAAMAELEGRFPALEGRGVQEGAEEAGRVARSLMFLEKWDRQLAEAWAGLAC